MERRLAEIPASEWGDLSIDVTPREYVLDYLAKGFPTQLYERYADENGNLAFAARRAGRPARAIARGGRNPRPADRETCSAAAGADRARSDPASFRRGARGRGHGPHSPHREEDRRGRPRPACRRKPARLRQSRRDAKLHGRQEAHPRVLGRGRHRALLSRRSFGAGTRESASIICWSPAGRPIPPFRALAARTAPIRRSRRCSGPSPPM